MINILGGVKRPIKALADKYPADKFPEIAKYVSYIDFYGLDSEYDYDPFWAKVVELGVPVTTPDRQSGVDWTLILRQHIPCITKGIGFLGCPYC